ncbi:MAG: hypothetical protein VX278_16995 [Myxococcota bacterium]|nr:hypothetical protein [Myxococcota bacterium]
MLPSFLSLFLFNCNQTDPTPSFDFLTEEANAYALRRKIDGYEQKVQSLNRRLRQKTNYSSGMWSPLPSPSDVRKKIQWSRSQDCPTFILSVAKRKDISISRVAAQENCQRSAQKIEEEHAQQQKETEEVQQALKDARAELQRLRDQYFAHRKERLLSQIQALSSMNQKGATLSSEYAAYLMEETDALERDTALALKETIQLVEEGIQLDTPSLQEYSRRIAWAKSDRCVQFRTIRAQKTASSLTTDAYRRKCDKIAQKAAEQKEELQEEISVLREQLAERQEDITTIRLSLEKQLESAPAAIKNDWSPIKKAKERESKNEVLQRLNDTFMVEVERYAQLGEEKKWAASIFCILSYTEKERYDLDQAMTACESQGKEIAYESEQQSVELSVLKQQAKDLRDKD